MERTIVDNSFSGYPNRVKDFRKRRRWSESLIQKSLLLTGVFSIFTTLGIVYTLGKEALLFFNRPEVNLIEFLTGTKWQPHIGEFGVLPLATATLLIHNVSVKNGVPQVPGFDHIVF